MANQVTRTQAIAAVLKARTHADLADLYNFNMECQVNVAQDGGQRIQSEYHGRPWMGWTDGAQTWKSFRIPYNASTTPEYEDKWISFDLDKHAEGIGMTGWDWKSKLSRWVAYDFDAITGHADKHQKKLTDEQLTELRRALENIEWVTLRKSTGGKGLHLYVFMEPVLTSNHVEHAALARAILGKLSALTKTDLATKVDICGQNMWVWHRKMSPANEGLMLLKRGSILKEIPVQWKDHIKVISGHRKKTLPKFLGSTDADSQVERKFDDISTQITRVPLDEDHRRVIVYLEERGTGSWWDQDHHMLVTHTYWLKKAHEEMSLRGKFETNSAGDDAPTDINCFLFPLRRGGWSVRRYSLGVAEHESWEQDGKGWTRCFFNTDPTLSNASRIHGGVEDPSNGSFVFNEAEIAADTIRLLGGSINELPVALRGQKATLKTEKDGRVSIQIEGDDRGILAKADDMKGWLFKKGKWIRAFGVTTPQQNEVESNAYDDQVRHLVTNANQDAGWALKGETDEWRQEPLTHVMNVLHSLGLKQNDIKSVVGHSVLRAWKLVNRPFQPEYPGDRVWNRDAAQLRFVPSQKDQFHYPHWKMILDHVGSGLNTSLQANGWAKANGILTGGDYLKLWIASLFKEPLQPLPYLFLYGPQNSGKSILHEALSMLFTRGYVRADNALTNQQGFNGELANAVLCIVEEINLRRDNKAAARIKDWVTARDLSVHSKGSTPYQMPNATHWIQASNESTACPVLPGDTRITSIYVSAFEDITQMIPKKAMLDAIEREAPDFLGELMSLEIPPSNDRLNVPVIRTAEKAALEEFNRSPVEMFLAEKVFQVDGEFVLYGDLYDQFVAFLDPSDAAGWTKRKFGQELPPQFPKGRNPKNGQYIIGNLSFAKPDLNDPKKARLKATAPDEKDNVFLEPENGDNNKRSS